jgi:hypothetical protein
MTAQKIKNKYEAFYRLCKMKNYFSYLHMDKYYFTAIIDNKFIKVFKVAGEPVKVSIYTMKKNEVMGLIETA